MISLRVHKELKSQQQDFFFKYWLLAAPAEGQLFPHSELKRLLQDTN